MVRMDGLLMLCTVGLRVGGWAPQHRAWFWVRRLAGVAAGIFACPLIWRGAVAWVLMRDPGGAAQL